MRAAKTEGLVLSGRHVRLEPLDHRHLDGLVAAAASDSSLYQWSPVPQGNVEAASNIETALAWRDAGSAVPFATIRHVSKACLSMSSLASVVGCYVPAFTRTRNQRLRAQLERIGGKFEGILRSHRMAADHTARDSVRS